MLYLIIFNTPAPFFIMAAPPAPTNIAMRSIGDLNKEDDQMIIILCSVQFRNAHVILGRSNKGVSGTIFITCHTVADCHHY